MPETIEEHLYNAFTETERDEAVAKLPTIPGMYTDEDGSTWILTEDGHWVDEFDDTREPKYNFVLGMVRTFTRVGA